MKPWIASKNQLKGDSFPGLGISPQTQLVKTPTPPAKPDQTPISASIPYFSPQCVCFPHFPTPEVSQENPARKTPKTARKCSYKYTDLDQLTQNPHSRKKEKIPINKNKQTNKQTNNQQNPSTLSKNSTQTHGEEAILVSEKNNALITSLPATCSLFPFFFF